MWVIIKHLRVPLFWLLLSVFSPGCFRAHHYADYTTNCWYSGNLPCSRHVCVCVCVCERESVRERVAQLCSTLVTPWTVALQAPLSMGFSRQVCWSGLPFLAPGSSPPSDEPGFPAFQVDAFLFWIHQSCQQLYDKNHVFTLISLMKKKTNWGTKEDK